MTDDIEGEILSGAAGRERQLESKILLFQKQKR